MKNLLSITSLALLALTSSCKKSADDTATTGTIPSAGWRIGTTNYTTFFTIKNAGQPNSIAFFDAIPGTNNLNSASVLFNNTTGIAAGTFKVVTKPNQSDLLANEIMVATSTGYQNSIGNYTKDYVTAPTETVNATVTITNGKAKIVVPQINIVSIPITSTSTTATFSGTFIEK